MRTRYWAIRHRRKTPLGRWTPVRTGASVPEKSQGWRSCAQRTVLGLHARPPRSPTCSARTRAPRAP